MKIYQKFKSKFLKRVLKATGLCTACFIFEACYGSPEGEFEPIINEQIGFTGWVKDDSTKIGIENISVKIENLSSGQSMRSFTDQNGNYNVSIPALKNDEVAIYYLDVDSTDNNLYEDKDTIVGLSNIEYNNKHKEVNVFLKEQ